MLSFAEALSRAVAAAPPLAVEEVPLGDAAGRVLAEPVDADLDLPPFDTTAMDGWAVDAASASGTVDALSTVGAGSVFGGAVPRGSAVKLMTGAPLPEGTDSVVPVEEAEELPGGRVRLLAAPAPGAHVRRRGEVLREGTRLVPAGRRLRPADLGLAAAAGRERLRVARKAVASVLVTGDELVPPGDTPGPGRIRNTNGPLLLSALARNGCLVRDLGTAGDDPGPLSDALSRALAGGPDLLLTTGGVSAGDFDAVGEVLTGLGAELLFHRVAMRPGKPVLLARRGGTLVFGLPGNPVSVAVAFDLLVRPVLRRMAGLAPPLPPPVRVTLTAAARNRGGRLAFLPGIVSAEGGRLLAEPVPMLGSHDVAAHARANAWLVLPGDGSFEAGDGVEAHLGGEETTLG